MKLIEKTKKSKFIVAISIVLACALIFAFINFVFEIFVPRIDYNEDGSFTLRGITYFDTGETNYGVTWFGKRVAILKESEEFERSYVQEFIKNDGEKEMYVFRDSNRDLAHIYIELV